MEKKCVALYGIWAAIDWGRLSVGLSHPLAGAEAVLFGDPSNQPGKLYTPEEEPSLDQSVIVQLHPGLVSIDTFISYTPKFNQKENINSFEQNFSSLAKLPVIRQCC